MQSAEAAKEPGILRKFLFSPFFKTLLKAALAAGIILFLVHRAPDGLLDTLKKMDPLWICLALLLYALHIFANAWRWWLLLRAQKIECSLMLAVSLTRRSNF